MVDAASQFDLPLVLLIDDDLVSREVTATLLTISGYTVQTVESGEAALEMIRNGLCEPGAILCDAQLPGLSGVELIGELRSACTDVPVYVISASRPAEAIVAAGDGLLLKPFDADALWSLFRRESEQSRPSFRVVDEPVVSIAVLNKLRQVMPEKAVREIYSAMVTDLDRRIEALESAFSRHDVEAVRRLGHSIKGGCAMAGAMRASKLGALLEAEPLGQDNQLDNSRALLADLRATVLELHCILEHELPA